MMQAKVVTSALGKARKRNQAKQGKIWRVKESQGRKMCVMFFCSFLGQEKAANDTSYMVYRIQGASSAAWTAGGRRLAGCRCVRVAGGGPTQCPEIKSVRSALFS